MSQSRGTVIGVNGNMVSVQVEGEVALNEVAYITVESGDSSDEAERRLKSEVIRIRGARAELQVFEMTTDIGVGDQVEFTGELLAVELGPGLLAKVYDGLQNPLPELAEKRGFFLDRGVYMNALDRQSKWRFTPRVAVGDTVERADTLGTVPEGMFEHRIMVPFNRYGSYTVKSIVPEGEYVVTDEVAVLQDPAGNEVPVTMMFEWPVKRAVDCYADRLKPEAPMVTKVRIIDTFFPRRARRHLLHPRSFRRRKDGPPADYEPQRGRGHRSHRRMRRACR